MTKFFAFLQSYVATIDRDEDVGAGIAEYALLVAGIAVLALGAVRAFGGALGTFFGNLPGQLF
jgi:Flp pilus assembly pilin Flp